MLKCRYIWTLLSAIAIACCSIFLYAQQHKTKQNDPLPAALMQQLNRYKAQDSLGAWLQCCTGFIKALPEERYSVYDYADTALWRSPRTDSIECSAYFRYLLCHGYDALKIYGDVPASKNCYEAALRLYDTAGAYTGKDSLYLAAYLLKPLGNIYTRLGDYKSALLIANGSRELWLQTGDSEEMAAVQGNIALAYRWQDSLQAAIQAVQTGLHYTLKNTSAYAYLQAIAAEISFCKKDNIHAAYYAAEALTAYEQLLLKADADTGLIAEGLSGVYSTRALIAASDNKLQQAVAGNKQALKYLQKYFPDSHKREQAIVWRQLGDVYLQQQQYEAGMSAYDKSIRQLLTTYPDTALFPERNLLFADNTLIDAIAGKSNCLLAQGQDAAALKGLMLAAAMEQQLRLHFQSQGSKLHQLAGARHRTEQILELASGLYERDKDDRYLLLMLQQIERSKAQLLTEQWVRKHQDSSNNRSQLQADISYYRQWLAAHDTAAAAYGYYVHQLKVSEYRAALEDVKGYHTIMDLVTAQDSAGPQRLLDGIPDSMAALEYFCGQKQIYVLTLVYGHVAQLKIIDSAEYWQNRVLKYMDTWYYNGGEAMQETPDLFCHHSRELFHCFVPELLWQQYPHCLVLPDDYLYRLPFDALQTAPAKNVQDPASWPYLLHQTQIQTDASLQLWQQRRLRQQNKKQKKEAVGISGFFVATFSKPYAPLPEVHKEYEQIKPLCATRLLDRRATKSKLLQALQQNEVVHISTHGVTIGADQDPVLVMGDSLLYAWELSAFQASAPLVVLNTCRGADGITEQGEGMVSMARYLTASGFSGVVASLWNVNDQAGAGWIQSFYQQLSDLQRPDLALQQAKILWLADTRIPLMNKVPYYWAGFTYTGVTQEIILERPSPLWLKYLLLPGILLLSGICWLWYRRYTRII